MRHTLCALVGLALLFCTSLNAAAAETGSRWWPFGHKDEAAVTPPPAAATATAPSTPPLLTPYKGDTAANFGATGPLAPQSQAPAVQPEATPKENWMLSSPKGKVGWPRLNKPQMPSAFTAKKPPVDATRNSWAEQPVTPKPSPLQPIKDGASKVGKGTKAAWHKTVDALTPGEPEPSRPASARIAKQEAKPSVWKRMWGEKPEPQGSQTMPGFIAQQRVDSAPTQTR